MADGLSALAVAQNAALFPARLLPRLRTDQWSLAPVTIFRLGGLAVADEVAECLGARLLVLLIGERPGLSSPDSMGLYVTWAPRVCLTEDARRCISHVRPTDLSHEDAADKLRYLLGRMHQRQLYGVQLTNETVGWVGRSVANAAASQFFVGLPQLIPGRLRVNLHPGSHPKPAY